MNSNPRVIQCGVPQGSILRPFLFLIFIYDITKDDCTFKLCTRWQCYGLCWTNGNELNCLNRWLKSNKIIINADKTLYMLFSYNKNVNFPIIRIDCNKINETSVTKFLCIYLDKKLNFVNHVTEMSMKVAKSIGLLYILNPFLTETIKTLYTSIIHRTILITWYRSMGWNISKLYL